MEGSSGSRLTDSVKSAGEIRGAGGGTVGCVSQPSSDAIRTIAVTPRPAQWNLRARSPVVGATPGSRLEINLDSALPPGFVTLFLDRTSAVAHIGAIGVVTDVQDIQE